LKKPRGALWFLLAPRWLSDRSDQSYRQPSSLTVANLPLALATLVIGLCLFHLAYPLLEHLVSGLRLGLKVGIVLLGILPLFIVCLFCAAVLVLGFGPEWNRRYGWIRFPVIAALLMYVYFDMTGAKQGKTDESPTRQQASSVAPVAPLRAVSVGELLARRRDAAYKWLEDINAAGAHGADGVVPPMLIVETTAATVSIENISGHEIGCIHLQRGASSCSLESDLPECSPLKPGDTRRYQQRGDKSCSRLPIEYRLGSLESPEVSWWSDSALARWRRSLVSPETEDEFAIDTSDEHRRAELFSYYEQQLADVSRASQWKNEQALWQKWKADWKMFRGGPSKEDVRAGWSAARDDRLDPVADVLASNRFGPPAAIPKFLEVREDEQGMVAVVNRSQEPLFVGVSRARERLSPFEPAHCELGAVFVAPGGTEYFSSTHTSQSVCGHEPRGALEFVVESDGRLAWITTSRVHDYLRLDPLLVDNPAKQVKAERARRAKRSVN